MWMQNNESLFQNSTVLHNTDSACVIELRDFVPDYHFINASIMDNRHGSWCHGAGYTVSSLVLLECFEINS